MIYKTIKINDIYFKVIDVKNLCTQCPRLLIQGLGCEAKVIWGPLAEELELVRDDRRLIAFNSRGIGGSSGWPESIEQMADDASSILSYLKINSVDVVGHSLGGAIAISLAARHPGLVRSIVLMDSVPTYNEKAQSGFRWRAGQILSAHDVSVILDIVLPRSFGIQTQTSKKNIIRRFRSMLSLQDPEVYAQLCGLAATVNVWPEFNKLQIPTLMIVGKEDSNTTPEIMYSLASKMSSNLIEVPNAGHNPPLEQPKYVAKVLKKYSLQISKSSKN